MTMKDDDLDLSSLGEQAKSAASPLQISRNSVHQALGGGAVADVLLWRRRSAVVSLLFGSSTMWFLFERAGYNLLSLVANVLLLLVILLFFWAKSASLLNRPLPPLPDLEVSDAFVGKASDTARLWINRVLAIAHDISIGRDVKLFIQVALCLLLISYLGSFFNFFTLLYIGVLLSLTVPAFYDKYQDPVDEKLNVAHTVFMAQYRKIDDIILSKIPMPLNKEKKTQ